MEKKKKKLKNYQNFFKIIYFNYNKLRYYSNKYFNHLKAKKKVLVLTTFMLVTNASEKNLNYILYIYY